MPDGKAAHVEYDLPKLWIDEPAGRWVQEAEFELSGWGVCNDPRILQRLAFRTSAGSLPSRKIERRDVNLSDTSLHAIGFVAPVSLNDHLSAVSDGKLKIWVLAGNAVIGQFYLRLAPGAMGKALQLNAG
jgi:hypothetical protein